MQIDTGCPGRRLYQERERERQRDHETVAALFYGVFFNSIHCLNGEQANWKKHEMEPWEGKGGWESERGWVYWLNGPHTLTKPNYV